MQHQLLFSGNDIFLDKSPESIGKSYSVLLEQEVFVQNDPSKNCKNYPTSNYHCYKVSPVVVTSQLILNLKSLKIAKLTILQNSVKT